MAEDNNITEVVDSNDMNAMDFFLNLKRNYESQRGPWESKWKQALAAYHLTDQLDKVYEGRSNIQVPVMKWKVNGLSARINRILFNVAPIGRIEDKKITDIQENIVDLWNKYIFENQLEQIGFKESFKEFVKNKTIEGTAVAKITQEFEEKEFTFFEDQEPENVVVKDNTYFRNILLTEFYSDVNQMDINDSQACIHSTVVPMEHLRTNQKRTEVVEFETEEGIVEERVEKGIYKNVHLLVTDGENITDQQAEYIQFLGLNKGETVKFERSLKEVNKNGFVQLDECYGKFDLDGDGIAEEVICTIANGKIVVRLEPTPFKHKKYVRPFIVGRYEPISNCLYGHSNVISGLKLLMELNASRAQATDAKTRSVSPMWYVDETKNTRWDGVWRPNGKVYGQGQNGMVPLLNPNLSNVSIQDSEFISRDLDQLWSLSPVQQGTSDNRLIPSTARGTLSVIAQNDMPLNDMIDNTIEMELKPFIEMIFERNLVFKDVDDLLVVWDEKDIAKAELDPEQTSMKDLLFEFNVKILGNLELSNEVAHQQGWNNFIQWAVSVPPVAKRLDWQALADKQLRSFGIKDDSEGIWLDNEILLQIDQEQQQAQQQQAQAQQQAIEQSKQESRSDYRFKKEVDTEAKLVEMQSEAVIEKTSGQKVQ